MVKILIVDDAQFMRNILKKIFEASGHEIVGEADTADTGIAKIPSPHPSRQDRSPRRVLLCGVKHQPGSYDPELVPDGTIVRSSTSQILLFLR